MRSRPSFPLWGGLRVDAERYGYRLRYVAAEALAWLFSLARRGRQVPSGRSKTTPATQVTAAPDALAAGGVSAGVRHFGAGAVSGLRATYQRVGTVGLRLVVAFAAVCLFAGTAFAVPGFRNAIGSIASSSSGGTGPGGGTGGASSNGTGHPLPGVAGVPTGPRGTGKYTASPSPTSTCVNPTKTVPKANPTTPGMVAPVPSITPTTAPTSADDRAEHHTDHDAADASADRLGQPDADRHHAGFRVRLGQPGDPEPVRHVQAVYRPGPAGVCSSAAGLRLSDQAAVRGVSVGALGAATRPAEPGRGDGVAHGHLLG